jgi:hypothetical protein
MEETIVMKRDEAVDLLQVMLLDEREPPPLIPKGLIVRSSQPKQRLGFYRRLRLSARNSFSERRK